VEGEKRETVASSESLMENPTLQLLVAWKHFIVIAAKLKVKDWKILSLL